MRAKLAGKIIWEFNRWERSEPKMFEKKAFPQILGSKGQIIYFPSRRGQIIYFQHFQCQNIYFQKVPAPPPPPDSESNGRPLTSCNENGF